MASKSIWSRDGAKKLSIPVPAQVNRTLTLVSMVPFPLLFSLSGIAFALALRYSSIQLREFCGYDLLDFASGLSRR